MTILQLETIRQHELNKLPNLQSIADPKQRLWRSLLEYSKAELKIVRSISCALHPQMQSAIDREERRWDVAHLVYQKSLAILKEESLVARKILKKMFIPPEMGIVKVRQLLGRVWSQLDDEIDTKMWEIETAHHCPQRTKARTRWSESLLDAEEELAKICQDEDVPAPSQDLREGAEEMMQCMCDKLHAIVRERMEIAKQLHEIEEQLEKRVHCYEMKRCHSDTDLHDLNIQAIQGKEKNVLNLQLRGLDHRHERCSREKWLLEQFFTEALPFWEAADPAHEESPREGYSSRFVQISGADDGGPLATARL